MAAEIPVDTEDKALPPSLSDLARTLPPGAVPAGGSDAWHKWRFADGVELLYTHDAPGFVFECRFITGTEARLQFEAMEALIAHPPGFSGPNPEWRDRTDLLTWGTERRFRVREEAPAGWQGHAWSPGRFASVALNPPRPLRLGRPEAFAALTHALLARFDAWASRPLDSGFRF